MTCSILRLTVFLFAVATLLAREDPLYHAVLLALTCSSILRHWAAFVTPVIAHTDRALAHLCYALCAHTHLIEHRSITGFTCLAAVLGLWVYEHYVQDWRRVHALLHSVAFFGIVLAVKARGSPT